MGGVTTLTAGFSGGALTFTLVTTNPWLVVAALVVVGVVAVANNSGIPLKN